jgi:ABC-type uncharacterized transport system substrate-binding protein
MLEPSIAIEAAQYGLIETLEKSRKANYRFTTYIAYDDRIKARTQTEEIVSSNPDLIFTIGATCSQMAKEITCKRKKHIPIVFTAVKGPAEINLVESEASSGNHLTGVTGLSMSFEQRLSIMLMLKPLIKKALIPYNPGGYFIEKDQQETATLLRNRGIEVQPVAVYYLSELGQKISPFLQGSDKPNVIITMRDSIGTAGVEALVKLCNNAGVALFSAYSHGVKKGAAFGIGSFDEAFGISGAQLVKQVLEEGRHPSDIPITALFDGFYRLIINEKAVKKQNVNIDPNLFFIMKNTVMI